MDQGLRTIPDQPNGLESSFGLTADDVRKFREICTSVGVLLTENEVADSARGVLVLYRMLLGPLPEDPTKPEVSVGSNVGRLASLPSRKL